MLWKPRTKEEWSTWIKHVTDTKQVLWRSNHSKFVWICSHKQWITLLSVVLYCILLLSLTKLKMFSNIVSVISILAILVSISIQDKVLLTNKNGSKLEFVAQSRYEEARIRINSSNFIKICPLPTENGICSTWTKFAANFEHSYLSKYWLINSVPTHSAYLFGVHLIVMVYRYSACSIYYKTI